MLGRFWESAGRAGLQPRRNHGSRPLFVPRPHSLQPQAVGARDTEIIVMALLRRG
jgi:hypothetical protein